MRARTLMCTPPTSEVAKSTLRISLSYPQGFVKGVQHALASAEAAELSSSIPLATLDSSGSPPITDVDHDDDVAKLEEEVRQG